MDATYYAMTSLHSHIRVALALFAFGIVFVAAAVYAQEAPLCDGKGFCALAVPPPSSKLGQLYGTNSLSGFLSSLFTAAISVGAILAVLRIGYAGYLYMTTDAWGSKTHAKEVIGDVVLGLLLLLGTWLILNQINPQILNLNALQNVQQAPLPAAKTQGNQNAPIPETGFAPGGRDPFTTPDCPAGQHKDTVMGLDCIPD